MASYARFQVQVQNDSAQSCRPPEVNINPSADKGGSFMDAGAVYFKDMLQAHHALNAHTASCNCRMAPELKEARQSHSATA